MLAAVPAACLLICSCAIPAEKISSSQVSQANQTAEDIPTLCSPGERVLYSCRLEDRQIASMCLGSGTLSYRESFTTRADRVQFAVSSNEDWSNIHLGHVVGGGGGHQSHVRFTGSKGDNYIVLEGAPGQYHDAANGSWSGVSIVRRDGEDNSRRCKSGVIIEPDWPSFIEPIAPNGSRPLMEKEGSEFDGWY